MKAEPAGKRTETIQTIRSFRLGHVVMTRNALNQLESEDVLSALERHSSCDWGECCEKDAEENELSLREGFRLLSVYRDRNETKFWIITEADRSTTTVLLPKEF